MSAGAKCGAAHLGGRTSGPRRLTADASLSGRAGRVLADAAAGRVVASTSRSPWPLSLRLAEQHRGPPRHQRRSAGTCGSPGEWRGVASALRRPVVVQCGHVISGRARYRSHRVSGRPACRAMQVSRRWCHDARDRVNAVCAVRGDGSSARERIWLLDAGRGLVYRRSSHARGLLLVPRSANGHSGPLGGDSVRGGGDRRDRWSGSGHLGRNYVVA